MQPTPTRRSARSLTSWPAGWTSTCGTRRRSPASWPRSVAPGGGGTRLGGGGVERRGGTGRGTGRDQGAPADGSCGAGDHHVWVPGSVVRAGGDGGLVQMVGSRGVVVFCEAFGSAVGWACVRRLLHSVLVYIALLAHNRSTSCTAFLLINYGRKFDQN